MKKYIVETLCDRKDIHPETEEPGHEVYLLNSKSQPVLVDLCDSCEKGTSILEGRQLADAIGQAVDLPGPRSRRARKKS